MLVTYNINTNTRKYTKCENLHEINKIEINTHTKHSALATTPILKVPMKSDNALNIQGNKRHKTKRPEGLRET